MSNPKAKREYVVGHKCEGGVVWGRDAGTPFPSTFRCVFKMSKTEADQIAKSIRGHCDVCIYRLVPVATGRVVNGKFVERKKAKKKAARRAKADVPRVVKASDGNWDIRTTTHYWSRRLGKWCKPYLKGNHIGLYTKRQCLNSLPAARAAWKAMKRGRSA